MDGVPTFRFKRFSLSDRRCGMKIGTDGVLLGAWTSLPCETGTPTILDAGSGSGLIALMIAQRLEGKCDISAVELDESSFLDLQDNIEASIWNNSVHPVNSDYREISGRFDLIASNPPFFSSGEVSPQTNRALARHADTLSPMALPAFAAEHLSSQGRLSMIFPITDLPAVEEAAAFARLDIVRLCEVTTTEGKTPTRIMTEMAHAPASEPLRRETLTIRDKSGAYTPEYINLTKDFYLHL